MTRTTERRRTEHPVKVVYFATGTPSEVTADFSRLRLTGNGARLRVVAPLDAAGQLAKAVQANELIRYRRLAAPVVWLRLLVFLGFSRRVEILCLTSPQRFRFLKMLALTLRGRVIFSPVSGARVPLGCLDLSAIWLRQRWDLHEQRRRHLPIGVVGAASGYYLERIVPAVRTRYPGAPIHGLLPPSATAQTRQLFDGVRTAPQGLLGALGETWRLFRERARYQRWVIPCTNEPYRFLKLASFLWPLTRRQIYNEQADGFAVRDVRMLGRHLRWRLRDQLSIQILIGAAGGSFPVRLLHLTFYGVRLLAAVPLLLKARVRALLPRSGIQPGRQVRYNRAGESSIDETKSAVRIKLAGPISSAPRPPAEPGGSVSA
jgi:hypothetical protein